MNENRCVICGEVIPEGRQVCRRCELADGRLPRKDSFRDDTIIFAVLGIFGLILLFFGLGGG